MQYNRTRIFISFFQFFSSKFAELVIYCANAYKNLHSKFYKNFSYNDMKLLTFIIGIASPFIFRYFLTFRDFLNNAMSAFSFSLTFTVPFFLQIKHFFFIICKERNEYRNLGTSATRCN